MSSSSVYSVKELANWILDFADGRGVKLTNMSLNKLIYFAYEHALVSAGRKLTNAKIEAWDHGPVFREVYSSFKNFGAKHITERASRYNPSTNYVEVVVPSIAATDRELIAQALDPLIELPAFILREISHSADGAWARVWHHARASNPGMEISDEIISTSSPTASVLQ